MLLHNHSQKQLTIRHSIKIFVKSILIFAASLAVIYLIFAFSMGGFGNSSNKTLFPDTVGSSILFAHRGVTENYPENSLESIGEAKRLGFRAVEFDLRKSADGDFVLFHDADCKRMLGINSGIQDLPTGELKNHPLIFNGKPTPWFVPTLKEVLDRYHSDFIFYFDIKTAGFQEADGIAEIIRNYNIENQVIVASADALFILYIELRHPEIITALEGFNAGKEWMYSFIPKKLRPDFLSGFLTRIDENHVKWLKKKDLLCRRIVYGVDGSNYSVARELGIKHMIIDYDSVSPVLRPIKFLNPEK